MADKRTIEIEVLRYNPEKDAAPHFQTFKVPFTDDTSVLQGLQYIKDHLDGSLTFRWSCRMAICGSCGKMVNGVPVLSCHTFLRDYYPGKVRVEPLNHFPILRDLAIDQRREHVAFPAEIRLALAVTDGVDGDRHAVGVQREHVVASGLGIATLVEHRADVFHALQCAVLRAILGADKKLAEQMVNTICGASCSEHSGRRG